MRLDAQRLEMERIQQQSQFAEQYHARIFERERQHYDHTATHGHARYGHESAVCGGWQGTLHPHVHVPPQTYIVYAGQDMRHGQRQWHLQERLDNELLYADDTIRQRR
jgi:hypothetical protein